MVQTLAASPSYFSLETTRDLISRRTLHAPVSGGAVLGRQRPRGTGHTHGAQKTHRSAALLPTCSVKPDQNPGQSAGAEGDTHVGRIASRWRSITRRATCFTISSYSQRLTKARIPLPPRVAAPALVPGNRALSGSVGGPIPGSSARDEPRSTRVAPGLRRPRAASAVGMTPSYIAPLLDRWDAAPPRRRSPRSAPSWRPAVARHNHCWDSTWGLPAFPVVSHD